MSPFVALHTRIQPPTWRGPARVHLLDGSAWPALPQKRDKRTTLKPWLLVRPGSELERQMLASRGWWKFPRREA